MRIEECTGYKKLLACVEIDDAKEPGFHDYRAKFRWVLARASDYAEKTGLDAADILNAWEERRNYWYMNYYQESQQPAMKGDRVRVFETVADLLSAIEKREFRCPWCKGVSSDPHVCTSGELVDGNICDWKSYGLFGTLGLGASIFVKEKLAGENIFMPIAWEPR